MLVQTQPKFATKPYLLQKQLITTVIKKIKTYPLISHKNFDQ